jgi:ferredoxin
MYILNAAEKAGIDLPATCRGGICGYARVLCGCTPLTERLTPTRGDATFFFCRACVGKVVSGKVDQSDVRASYRVSLDISVQGTVS